MSKDIVCPYCGETLEFVLEYTGGGYSEHRDFTGIECGNYKCGATWDHFGRSLDKPSDTD